MKSTKTEHQGFEHEAIRDNPLLDSLIQAM